MSLRLEAKVLVPIIASVTIITLAVILVLVPLFMGIKACSEGETMGTKWKFCPQQAPTPIEQPVSTNGTNPQISAPPEPPKDPSVIQESYQKESPQNQVRLNSIVGEWNVAGQTYDGRGFSGSVNFGENNEFSAIVSLYGYVQPPRYGSYSYSPSDGTLTIHFLGSPPQTYDINSMTENSFSTIGTTESASYVRI